MNSSEDQIMIKNLSWWNRRTRLERYLIVTLGIISIIAVSITTVYILSLRKKPSDQPIVAEEEPEAICFTPGCIHTASNVLKYMDESVDPCDDFYQFACGGFLKQTSIPDDKTSVDSATVINKALKEQMRAIIEEPSNPKEPRSFKLLRRLYNICMNTDSIKAEGFETLSSSILKDLGGWPVLEGKHWDEDAFDWKNFTYQSRRLGLKTNSFLNLYVEIDTKNSSRRMLTLDEALLELTREDFIKGFDDELVQSYYEYMVDVAVILGADRSTAQEEMQTALEFEIKLAEITLSLEEGRNITGLYNAMSVAELQRKNPAVPWQEYINNVIDLSHVKISDKEVINVVVPKYVRKLITLLNKTSKRVLANYAVFKIVNSLVPFLTEEIKNREQEYTEAVYGTQERESRWKECVSEASMVFSKSAGALYVQKYFNEDAKDMVGEIASDIHSEINNTLKEIEWMDSKTREKALQKAESMSFHIAYPDELLDDTKVDEFYSKVNITSEKYLGFILDMKLFQYDYMFSKLRKPVNKSDWTSRPLPIVVNAMYFPEENSIDLPAGILQGVFFDPDRPRYMNYGGIGYVIAHEIIHGFDDQGRQFDKNGNLHDWWAKDTKEAFLKRAQCIIDQYGSLTVLDNQTKLHGKSTQGENIADNGGIKLAYSAYRSWVERNEPEPLLPGLNYTQNQLFWISAANTWCTKIRSKMLKQTVVEDVHSPPNFRVLIPFSNTEFFAEDFNCPVGSKMNPKEKCVVW